ncbi:alpha/beta hydrolase [Falsiruegeria litorea]|uniref:alpha/beta hydrolase n=1 Tax=Falsiruegeria litorea TaxID=1280831 RepID=UPI00268A61AC
MKSLVARFSGALLTMIPHITMTVVLASCSPPPELIGVDNPNVPVASVESAIKRKVFLMTTREATETVGAFYSGQRAPELGLASVQVSIPPTHAVGELERPKRLPPDPRTEFAVVEPTIYANDEAFIASVNRELRKIPRGQRDILFFVHGYNNTTSDAVLRLAQFVEDSGFQGVPVLFDWASAANLTRYVYDLNSALIARPRLPEISAIMNRTNAEGYDIFAHSMGAFLTMEAMKDAVQTGRFNSANRLQTIILAAPDIDMDLFRSQLEQIDTKFDRFFVLLSEDDSALNISRRISGGVPRVGASNIDELAALGVIAIDLSKVSNSSSGSHSKFAGSPEVVQLIGKGLNNNSRFDRSQRATRLGEIIGGAPISIAFE